VVTQENFNIWTHNFLLCAHIKSTTRTRRVGGIVTRKPRKPLSDFERWQERENRYRIRGYYRLHRSFESVLFSFAPFGILCASFERSAARLFKLQISADVFLKLDKLCMHVKRNVEFPSHGIYSHNRRSNNTKLN